MDETIDRGGAVWRDDAPAPYATRTERDARVASEKRPSLYARLALALAALFMLGLVGLVTIAVASGHSSRDLPAHVPSGQPASHAPR